MQIRLIAAAALAAAFTAGPAARANDAPTAPCSAAPAASLCADAPRDAFRPESQLRGVVENFLRYRVSRVAIDGGCYEVLASDRSGTPYLVRFRGSDLKMVSRHVVKATAPQALSSAQ